MNDSVNSHVTSCCDLGVIFLSDLSWTDHYKVISRNAYDELYVLKRSFSEFCLPHIKRLLYISLVCSELSYCSQVWRPMLIKDINCHFRKDSASVHQIYHWYSLPQLSRTTYFTASAATYVFL